MSIFCVSGSSGMVDKGAWADWRQCDRRTDERICMEHP